MAVASLFAGQATLEALQDDIATAAGARVPVEKLAEIAEVLIARGFLDPPEARARVGADEAAFLAGGRRPMVLADRSFPRERGAFLAMVDGFLGAAGRTAPRGP